MELTISSYEEVIANIGLMGSGAGTGGTSEEGEK